MINDFRGSLRRAVETAEIEKVVTPHTLRHTYTAARIQALDNGDPVHLFTVARELGHKNTALIERTYGHLLKTRARSSVVEYHETSLLRVQPRIA